MINERIENIKKWLNIGITELAESDVYYLLSLVPKELKHKKEVPTVIEYLGRRYVLDHGNK